jgi:hypothetical protein
VSVRAPQPVPDLPPQARACWAPAEDPLDEALSFVLDVIARQPLAAGVLLGRCAPVGEA